MTDTYLVNWLGGTSGAFVVALTHALVTGNTDALKCGFTLSGTAHNALDYCDGNFTGDSAIEYYQNNHQNVTPIYEIVKRKPNTDSFILFDHCIPVYDRLFSILPNSKNIVVTVNKKMVPRMLGNCLFKIIGEYNDTFAWDNIKTKVPYFTPYKHPDDVPPDLIGIYLSPDNISWPMNESLFYDENFSLPPEYTDRILRISLYDLIYKKQTVLHRLSEFTEKPITDAVSDYYDAYLVKQDNLVKTKMPCVYEYEN